MSIADVLKILVLLTLLACDSGLPTSATVDIADADDGGRFQAKIGQIVVVSLEANPSTGYTWEVVEVDETVLRQMGDPVFRPSSDLVGAPGVLRFQFRAVRSGETVLALDYRRPWETGVEPLKTFRVSVQVGD